MAFGDSGQWHVNVNGVPFRMDGETYDEAQARVLDTLSETPELFDLRARRLGLDQKDLDALQLRFERGEGSLKGLVRAEAAAQGNLRLPYTAGVGVGQGASKTLIGGGRQFVNRWRGARQSVAQLFGDEEAAKAVAQEDQDERGLYQQLDDTGVGMEDVGEIGTDIAMFLGTTALTGGGAIPMFMTGAALGAFDVKDEVASAGGGTEIEGGRGMDAALGGTFALAGPIASKAGGLIGAMTRKLGTGASVRAAPGIWMRIRALAGNPEAMVNVVDDALTYTATGADKGRQIIGRAALDKVQQILTRLPPSLERGLKDPAAFGILRNAVKKATVAGADGVNVFNPAVFEKEATALIGQLPNIFSKSEHQFMASAIGQLSKAMQSLPEAIPAATAERAAAALALAKPSSEAILKALKLATNPSVVRGLIDSLADKGGQAMASLRQSLPNAALAGASENVATEGAEDVNEVIGGRQRDRAGR